MSSQRTPIEAEQTTLALDELHPAADNPRRHLGDLTELAASMRTVGLLEPIVVTPNADGYTIVAGARRHAAAKKAGLDTVPVVVLANLSEEQRQEAMLIENLQRTDLMPLEEAGAFQRLLDLGLTQKDLAAKIGRSASHISKRIQLLKLPEPAREALDAGTLPVNDALELAPLSDAPESVVRSAIALITEEDDWRDKVEPKQAVEMALADHARATILAALIKQALLDPAEFAPLGDEEARSLPAGAMALKGQNVFLRSLPITIAKHRKEICHRITVYGASKPAIVFICADPKSHPEFKAMPGAATTGRGALSDKEKEARKAKREHNAALRAATLERHEFLRRFFTKKMTAAIKDEAIVLLLSEYFARETGVPFGSRGTFAASLVGVQAKKRGYQGPDHVGALKDHVKANAHEVLRTALAVGVGAVEDNLTGNYPSWSWVTPYYEFLARQGYSRSAAEQSELSGKAPK